MSYLTVPFYNFNFFFFYGRMRKNVMRVECQVRGRWTVVNALECLEYLFPVHGRRRRRRRPCRLLLFFTAKNIKKKQTKTNYFHFPHVEKGRKH